LLTTGKTAGISTGETTVNFPVVMSVVRLPGRYEATFICFDSALSFAYLFAFLRCFLAYGNCLL